MENGHSRTDPFANNEAFSTLWTAHTARDILSDGHNQRTPGSGWHYYLDPPSQQTEVDHASRGVSVSEDRRAFTESRRCFFNSCMIIS